VTPRVRPFVGERLAAGFPLVAGDLDRRHGKGDVKAVAEVGDADRARR
jgi:hypothetical protein